jgi:hypothetical protein
VLLLSPEASTPIHPDGSTLCSQSKIAPCVRCARAMRGVNLLLDGYFRPPDWVRRAPLIPAIFDSPSPITTPRGQMGGMVVLVLRRCQASEKILATARKGTMIVKRGLTAAVVAAGVSLGLASPAWADDLSGTYALNLLGASPGPHTTWIASSTCAPPGGCVAHITSSSGWSGDAQLAGDRWTMTVVRPDGQSCPDGTRHSELQTWSWDAAAQSGQVRGVSTDPAACPQTGPDSFTLTKMRSGAGSIT